MKTNEELMAGFIQWAHTAPAEEIIASLEESNFRDFLSKENHEFFAESIFHELTVHLGKSPGNPINRLAGQ